MGSFAIRTRPTLKTEKAFCARGFAQMPRAPGVAPAQVGALIGIETR